MSGNTKIDKAYLALDFRYEAGNAEDQARTQDFHALVRLHLCESAVNSLSKWSAGDQAKEESVKRFIDTYGVYFWGGTTSQRHHLRVAPLRVPLQKIDRALSTAKDGKMDTRRRKSFARDHKTADDPEPEPTLVQDVAGSQLGELLQDYFYAVLDEEGEVEIASGASDTAEELRRRIVMVDGQAPVGPDPGVEEQRRSSDRSED